jgi:hypothetical protein
MVIELVGNIFDLLLIKIINTSSVCNFPLSDAGFDPKLCPV